MSHSPAATAAQVAKQGKEEVIIVRSINDLRGPFFEGKSLDLASIQAWDDFKDVCEKLAIENASKIYQEHTRERMATRLKTDVTKHVIPYQQTEDKLRVVAQAYLDRLAAKIGMSKSFTAPFENVDSTGRKYQGYTLVLVKDNLVWFENSSGKTHPSLISIAKLENVRLALQSKAKELALYQEDEEGVKKGASPQKAGSLQDDEGSRQDADILQITHLICNLCVGSADLLDLKNQYLSFWHEAEAFLDRRCDKNKRFYLSRAHVAHTLARREVLAKALKKIGVTASTTNTWLYRIEDAIRHKEARENMARPSYRGYPHQGTAALEGVSTGPQIYPQAWDPNVLAVANRGSSYYGEAAAKVSGSSLAEPPTAPGHSSTSFAQRQVGDSSSSKADDAKDKGKNVAETIPLPSLNRPFVPQAGQPTSGFATFPSFPIVPTMEEQFGNSFGFPNTFSKQCNAQPGHLATPRSRTSGRLSSSSSAPDISAAAVVKDSGETSAPDPANIGLFASSKWFAENKKKVFGDSVPEQGYERDYL